MTRHRRSEQHHPVQKGQPSVSAHTDSKCTPHSNRTSAAGPRKHEDHTANWLLHNAEYCQFRQLYPFRPQWFHVLLTLSSKFFATFPHGTCLLSVSWSYLALDVVYHLLRAAISGNSTPKRHRTNANTVRTGLTPSLVVPFQITSDSVDARQRHLYATLRLARGQEIQRWAYPFSLAVTNGILVSFFSSAY